MSFSNSHQPRPNRKNTLPEVADREPKLPGESCLDLSIDPQTEEVVNLKGYRVFLKRNLTPLPPPADLLASLNARLAAIDAEHA